MIIVLSIHVSFLFSVETNFVLKFILFLVFLFLLFLKTTIFNEYLKKKKDY